MFSISISPASAANEGTLKIYQTEQNCELNSNDPKILSPYWIGGFGFDQNASFTLTISTQGGQGGGTVVQTLTGTTDDVGHFCEGPVTTEPGMYKVEMTGAGDKSKVFTVEIPPLTEVTPVGPPAPTQANCEAAGVFNPPATQEGVIWTVAPANQTGPGTYTVTAAPAPGYTFPADAQTTWTVIVNPQQTNGCSTPPPAAVPDAVTPPTFTNATCEAPASMVIPADTAQIDYTTVGTATPGTTVTVTAVAIGNVVLTGYPTGGWSWNFTAAPTNCDSAVGGTEDDDTDTPAVDDSDSTDDEQAVAGSEDELAATGANVGPAGLGLLLILSGAAFITARRLALK
jgi:hypothetical protein